MINEDHGIMAFTFLVVVMAVAGIFLAGERSKLIGECEQHLSRDKHCKLIAVIEDENNGPVKVF